MNSRKEPDWRWPVQGVLDHPLNVRSVMSPYGQNGTLPAMCYPGTPLKAYVSDLVAKL